MTGHLIDSRDLPRLRRVVNAYEDGILAPATGALGKPLATDPPMVQAYLLTPLAPDPGKAKAVVAIPTPDVSFLIRVTSVIGESGPRLVKILVEGQLVTWPETASVAEVFSALSDRWTESPIVVHGKGVNYYGTLWEHRSWILSFPELPEASAPTIGPSADFDRATTRILRTRWKPGPRTIDVYPGLPFMEPYRPSLQAICRYQPGLGYVLVQAECDE